MDQAVSEVTVGGQPIDGAAAAKAAAARCRAQDIGGPVELLATQIVDAMSAGALDFGSEDAMVDNILFRIAVIEAMTNANTGAFDMDYYDPTNAIQPRIGSAGPSRLGPDWAFLIPKQDWVANFDQVPGTVAADAMDPSMGATFPYRGECAGAFQMAVLFGLRKAFGAAQFNQLVSGLGPLLVGPWQLSPRHPNPATHFMAPADLSAPPIPGDYMYFKNKDDYLTYAPDGFWQGLNALYNGNDALGTAHYSGMGASWLSEVNLRNLLVDAYYHDCYPHRIADPLTDVRFTVRNTLILPTTPASGAPSAATPHATLVAPTPEALSANGFARTEAGTHARSGPLGEVLAALGATPEHLVQSQSAGLDNPAHMVRAPGMTAVVAYANGSDDRRDPAAPVSVHVRLASAP